MIAFWETIVNKDIIKPYCKVIKEDGKVIATQCDHCKQFFGDDKIIHNVPCLAKIHSDFNPNTIHIILCKDCLGKLKVIYNQIKDLPTKKELKQIYKFSRNAVKRGVFL